MKTLTSHITINLTLFAGVFLSVSGISENVSAQAPPSKLVRQDLNRPNPLRGGTSDRLPLPAPKTNQQPIQQTALESGNESGITSFDDFPVFDSASAPATSARTTDLSKPQPALMPPSSLDNADPFENPQPAASVPATALPTLKPAAPTQRIGNQLRQQTAPAITNNDLSLNDELVQTPFSINAEGTGIPGAAALEGQQTPHLTIQKILPTEVIVEQPTIIKTVIQNVGKSTARNVQVTDRVPKGCKLLATTPEATMTNQGEMYWSFGNLDANDQIVIETRIVPLREGEIGSVASVNYTGEVSARIEVTRPMIKIEVKAPTDVQLGEVVNVEITISNPGTATATGIVLEEHVPDGLYHKNGRVLANKNVNSLKPKEAKKLTFPLVCTGAGNLVNQVIVKADGNLVVEEKTTIRAAAPVLDLQIVGSQQRFLERPSDYKLLIANTGNASARNVDLTLSLPATVKFVKTNQSGVYEPQTHSVHWALEELPAQESGEIDLVLLPTQIGQQSLKFAGVGQNNLKAETMLPLEVDGLPALTFEFVGANLVEIGKDAVYEIRVMNKGTKAASNVNVFTHLADGMLFLKAEGGRFQANGGVVRFEPIPQLEPKAEKVYKVAAKCQNDGDYRVSVKVISDDLRSPITREESTRVFR